MALLNEVIPLWIGIVVLILSHSQGSRAGNSRFITNESYIYRLKYPNNSVCLTLSLNADFVFSYERPNNSNNGSNSIIESRQLKLPNSTRTKMSGNCGATEINMSLTWSGDDRGDDEDEYTVTFIFSVNTSLWYLSQVQFQFYVGNASELQEGFLTYVTSPGIKSFFNRTFNKHQYFHCKSCKNLWLLEGNDRSACYTYASNKTSCSYLAISNSVIFPGDLDSNTTSIRKKLCIEDYIELQEIIVPAVVGGILGILLIVIFGSYLIAFIRRKRKEGRYESISNGGF